MTTETTREIAEDIAVAIVNHLETMYPAALKAVPKTARLSLLNFGTSKVTASLDAQSAAFAERMDVAREACAKVASATTNYDDALQKSGGCMTVGERMAAAIRALPISSTDTTDERPAEVQGLETVAEDRATVLLNINDAAFDLRHERNVEWLNKFFRDFDRLLSSTGTTDGEKAGG